MSSFYGNGGSAGQGSAMTYLGASSTKIEENSHITPIMVGKKEIVPKNGNVVIYNSKEFIWSEADNAWHEFGSAEGLKALAFKDSAIGEILPTGSVSKPIFTGQQSTLFTKNTPKGTIGIKINNENKNYIP